MITSAQAVSAGLSKQAIRRLVRNDSWVKVRPGVYALWSPRDPQERWRQRLTAAALWIGAAGAVSHRAASVVWGLDGMHRAPIELITTGSHRTTGPGLVLHRVASAALDHVVVRDGMRITSVVRTLADLCAVARPSVVEQALESALRLRLTSLDEIRAFLETRTRPSRRARVLEALVCDSPDEATESILETAVWALLREAGLPPPKRQHEVRTHAGILVARVDLAYPDIRVAIEADGYASHSARRDWQRDRERQNALVGLGWKVYRATWEDVKRRPQQVVSDVAALCEPRALER